VQPQLQLRTNRPHEGHVRFRRVQSSAFFPIPESIISNPIPVVEIISTAS